VAFGMSFLLVNHLQGKKLYLPDFISQVIQYFNESSIIHSTNIESVKATNPLPQKIELLTEELDNSTNSKRGCVDHSLGQVKATKENKIYTWKDEQGINNFSDKKPANNHAKQLDLAGGQVFNYFSLNIVGAVNIPFEFKEKLSRSIHKMFAVYGQLIDKKQLKKVSVNLKFIASQKEYQRYRAKHAPSLKSSLGFYNNRTNQAVILYANSEQALKIALHESAHAINRGVIGSTNKWLNEGLAEYLETITTNLSSAEITLNPAWYRNNKLTYSPTLLSNLLHLSHSQWNNGATPQFYATSWAFIYFLMDDPNRKSHLAKLIKLEQNNMCDQLNTAKALNSIGVNTKTLQNSFYRWLRRADKFAHVI
jgi:hypothetical protein